MTRCSRRTSSRRRRAPAGPSPGASRGARRGASWSPASSIRRSSAPKRSPRSARGRSRCSSRPPRRSRHRSPTTSASRGPPSDPETKNAPRWLWRHNWSYRARRRIVDHMDGVTGDAAPPVSSSTVSSSSVSATLNYLRPGSPRNRLYVAPGGHLTTTQYAPTEVTIGNGRPHLDDFGLDRSGFTLLRHHSAVTDFGDKAQLDGTYTAEVAGPVKEGTGAGEGGSGG